MKKILVLALIVSLFLSSCSEVVQVAQSANPAKVVTQLYLENAQFFIDSTGRSVYGVYTNHGMYFEALANFRNGVWSIEGGEADETNVYNLIATATASGYRVASWWNVPTTVQELLASGTADTIVGLGSTYFGIPMIYIDPGELLIDHYIHPRQNG